ncbi:hypothetical protein [Tetragenococcus halophilus]|uniref:hypothetical protein n=1 Tax=Tetragenococcus halophilus TaxID=51669 RepID=UPI001F391C65|nr:hypothetical protein [Tetragenococcus halophilus]GMA45590.1 hypothetical protein GCM10025853_30470 [Tetragenococcus halophilus subsp. halophilus DSM 20339]
MVNFMNFIPKKKSRGNVIFPDFQLSEKTRLGKALARQRFNLSERQKRKLMDYGPKWY